MTKSSTRHSSRQRTSYRRSQVLVFHIEVFESVTNFISYATDTTTTMISRLSPAMLPISMVMAMARGRGAVVTTWLVFKVGPDLVAGVRR